MSETNGNDDAIMRSLNPNIEVVLTSFAAHQADIETTRMQVFHQEQQINPGLDFDGLDAIALQVLAFEDQQPIGTARVRVLINTAKIERVAVLASHRRQGIGTAMLASILSHLQTQCVDSATLNAQLTSVNFYQRLGFIPQGDVFVEAGIEHLKMYQQLAPVNPLSTQDVQTIPCEKLG